ncbi:MAG: class I SAM-dependent methyltransferase [bacterium]|nr:class I SAM-dependent methyltransferase [bacterium]
MFADPVSNLKQFGLRENMIVADLGAGTGFYSVAAGKIVQRGKVYAVEVQKDFLPTIKNKAKEAHLNNVECFWGNIEKIGGTKIKDAVVDAVIASDILFQVEGKEKFIEEIKRILKPGGKVLLIDWSDAFSGMGPNSKMLVPKETARKIFEGKGFIWKRDINAGSHHYGMILEKINE